MCPLASCTQVFIVVNMLGRQYYCAQYSCCLRHFCSLFQQLYIRDAAVAFKYDIVLKFFKHLLCLHIFLYGMMLMFVLLKLFQIEADLFALMYFLQVTGFIHQPVKWHPCYAYLIHVALYILHFMSQLRFSKLSVEQHVESTCYNCALETTGCPKTADNQAVPGKCWFRYHSRDLHGHKLIDIQVITQKQSVTGLGGAGRKLLTQVILSYLLCVHKNAIGILFSKRNPSHRKGQCWKKQSVCEQIPCLCLVNQFLNDTTSCGHSEGVSDFIILFRHEFFLSIENLIFSLLLHLHNKRKYSCKTDKNFSS